MSKLIVSLPKVFTVPSPTQAFTDLPLAHTAWEYPYVLTNDVHALVKTGTAPIDVLPQADATILVTPAQALSWHKVDLPKVPKLRLRAAIEGILEERLLSDTSDMAFAVSPDAINAKTSTNTWVAACDKNWLKQAITIFESAGHRVTQVVPAFEPADPSSSASAYVTGTTDDAYLTTVSSDGVLTLPFPNATQVVEDVVVYAEPAVTALAEQVLNRPIQLRPPTASLLQSAQSNWELAQFEQKLSGDGEGIKRVRRAWQSLLQKQEWRPLRWALLGLLFVNVIGLNAWAWQQKNSIDSKKTQLSIVLTQTFPQVKVVVDPALQMQKELTILQQATGASVAQNLENMLSAFAQATPQTVTPSGIDFIAGKTVMNGVTLTESDLAVAKSRMKAIGYALTIDGSRAIITPEGGL